MRRLSSLLLLSSIFLVGCGLGNSPAGNAHSPVGVAATAGLSGVVHGGQQPVTGATIQLWTVGTTGYASSATPLIATGSYYLGGTPGCVASSSQTCYSGIVSGPGGSWSITGDFSCASSPNQLVYVTATGGNPGLTSGTNNAALSLIAALGPCSGLTSTTPITIDEVTTVASVYALAQFMSSYSNVGSYSASTVGIANAFATVNNLVSISSGTARAYTPAGNGWVPQAEIDSLANILAACVNSPGGVAGDQSACGNLFSAAKPVSGTAPADTIQAMLDIAQNPANNTSTLYGISTSNAPFQPTLTATPNDWAMAVLYGGLAQGTFDLAIDASGDIWTANNGNSSGSGGVNEQNNLGALFANNPYFGSTSGLDAVAIDLAGNAWVGNYNTAQIYQISPGGSSSSGPFSLPETSNVESIAVDANNNVWIVNTGSNSVSELNNRGGSSQALSPSGGYQGGNLNHPVDVAPDPSGDVWVTDDNSNYLTEITSGGSVLSFTGSGLNGPAGIAVDASGDLWVIDSLANSLVEFSGSGSQVLAQSEASQLGSGGSFDAVDGANHIWFANQTGTSLSEYSTAGTLLSPALGYQGPNAVISSVGYNGPNIRLPFATRVDQSGNVWVTDLNSIQIGPSLSAGVTEFIGLAAPTIQPLAQALLQGQVGVKPGTPTATMLTVTTSILPSSVPSAQYLFQLLAAGGSQSGYTWTVTSGSSTLSSHGLSLSSSGLLTGTVSGTPTTASITVQVTDSANNTASKTLSLTIGALSPLSITTNNLPSATVGSNYAQSFAATGGSGSYSWSIASGQTALNGDALYLSLAGVLAGTPTSTGTFPTTVKVTDLATGQTATAPYTVIVNPAVLSQCTHDGSGNAILNGHYAFLLGGFDPNGHYYDQIGSFKADGAGNITNGMVDANGDKLLSQFANGETQSSFTGTYSIGSTDDRGIMTVINSSTSATSIFCLAADTVVSGVANSGRVIQADGTGYLQTGVFAIQNPNNFNASALTGGYAFGVQGVDTPPNRRVAVGQFTLNGSGGVSSGQLDLASVSNNNNIQTETYDPGLTYLSGSGYNMASNGRGTLTLNVNAGGTNESLTFVIYQLGSNQLFMLSTNDSTMPLLLGQATPQTLTTFTAANIAGRGVFRSDSSPGAFADDMQVGVLSYDGSGNISGIFDQNDEGTVTTPTSVATATYSVTSLGYVTTTNSGSHPVNFYLYAPGGGYGTSTSSAVDFWTMVPQTVPNGGFTTSSLSGAYALGTVPSAAYSTTGTGLANQIPYPILQEGQVTFGPGTLSLTNDQVYPPGTAADVSTGQTQSTSWVLDSTYGSSYGRVLLGGSGGLVGYIVSPTQVFLMNEKSGKDGSLLILDHQ